MRTRLIALSVLLAAAVPARAQPAEEVPLRVRTGESESAGYDVEVRTAPAALRCGVVAPGQACDLRVPAPARYRLTLRGGNGQGPASDVDIEVAHGGTLVEVTRSGTGLYVAGGVALALSAAGGAWWYYVARQPPAGSSGLFPEPIVSPPLLPALATVSLAAAGATFLALGRWAPLRRCTTRPLDPPKASLGVVPLPGGAGVLASAAF